MAIKIKISKKLWIRLAIFTALFAFAAIFDIYFEKSGVQLANVEKSTSTSDSEKGSVQFLTQSIDFGFKLQVLKVVQRKLQVKAHDKFIQKYYQLRNYQVLKAEVQTQTAPLINSYHYLAFKNYFYSVPDDVPLYS